MYNVHVFFPFSQIGVSSSTQQTKPPTAASSQPSASSSSSSLSASSHYSSSSSSSYSKQPKPAVTLAPRLKAFRESSDSDSDDESSIPSKLIACCDVRLGSLHRTSGDFHGNLVTKNMSRASSITSSFRK